MLPCRTTSASLACLALVLPLLVIAATAGLRPVLAQGSEGAPLANGAPRVRQVETINGTWRVHVGDIEAGASLALDDSGWQQIELGSAENKNLSTRPDILWFRARISSQIKIADPAILIAPLATGCQIFVNGAKVADCSQLPGPNHFIARDSCSRDWSFAGVSVSARHPARPFKKARVWGSGAGLRERAARISFLAV